MRTREAMWQKGYCFLEQLLPSVWHFWIRAKTSWSSNMPSHLDWNQAPTGPQPKVLSELDSQVSTKRWRVGGRGALPGGCAKVSKSHLKVQKVGILAVSYRRFNILLRCRLVIVFNSLECNLLWFMKCPTVFLRYPNNCYFWVYFSLTAIALTGRLLEPIPAAWMKEGYTPWMSPKPHCRAPCEHMGVQCLAWGYHGNTLKVPWHLPLLSEHLHINVYCLNVAFFCKSKPPDWTSS